jgi:phosphoribosylformimino-5-aminoimidazole carboxamide ribotide isomerase
MKLYPAIDLYGGNAVRLLKGDYNKMTVYNDDPVAVAKDFADKGAESIHVVDLEGARDGGTPALPIVEKIVKETGLFVEIGGGIRTMEVIDKYMKLGVGRVILGTAAVTDRNLLLEAVDKYGKRIAVGVDIKDGVVAIKGWLEKTELDAYDFCLEMEKAGVGAIICTDISKDGAMLGVNRDLYRKLKELLSIEVIASGGVTDMSDILALKDMGADGAIIGKAYYTGAIDLGKAVASVK